MKQIVAMLLDEFVTKYNKAFWDSYNNKDFEGMKNIWENLKMELLEIIIDLKK